MLDPTVYPSRTFIRFTARNQLLADLTGETVTATVQRAGGAAYVQIALPGKALPCPSHPSGAGAPPLTLGMTIHGSTDQASLPQGAAPSPREAEPEGLAIDESLFADITQTLFQVSCSPRLYQDCGSPEAARGVEREVATAIIAVYRQIKQNQTSPLVQSLNQRL
jgi:hypothetical protein